MLSGVEMMVVAGLAVLFFGGSKLPKLGSAVGETIKNFKNSVKDEEEKQSQIAAPKSDESDKK